MHPDEKIITFESYHDPMLAHIIRTKLEANDVPCFLEDEYLAGLNPLYNNALSGIKLKIFERDLERCKTILADESELQQEDHFEIDPETEDGIVCPFCASTNVEHINASENRPDWVNTLYSFFASTTPFYTAKQWHCCNCRQEFE